MNPLFASSGRDETARGRFRFTLLSWYDVNKRDLPWRRTRRPFQIWVSEIMLQQTRVVAVLEHYREFLRQFPSVSALARAREQQVLAAWSGLGYYRRARMLHAAAKQLMREEGGRLPRTAAGLQRLPGIGRYTAAAIASIGFDEPVAVVDGNVERVLARLAGANLGMPAKWKYAQALIGAERPGDFNQAMMELGATVCAPKAPNCGGCPVTDFCKTRGERRAEGAKVKQKQAQRNLLFLRRRDSVLLVQRAKKESVMPGMWELPESRHEGTTPLARVRHSIMDTDYEVRVFSGDEGAEVAKGRWVPISRLESFALTGTSRKVLRKLALLQ